MTETPKAVPKAKLEVLQATSEHAEVLARFFRAAWNSDSTSDSVHAERQTEAKSNPATAGQEVPTFIVVIGGQAIGHVTTIPDRLWFAGQERVVHWTKGLMVLPEYRNGPVGFILLKAAIHQLGPTLATVVAPEARRLFGALGFVDLGPVPNYILLLDPGAVARELDIEAVGLGGLPSWIPSTVRVARVTGLARAGGWLASAVRRTWAVPSVIHSQGFSMAYDPPSLDTVGLDKIWVRMRTTITVGSVRDGRHWIWRFGRRRKDQYRLLTAHRKGELTAMAAVRMPWSDQESRLRGIRVAILSDLVYDPGEPGAGLAALRGAERVARESGAHALLCSVTAASLINLLRWRGYIRIPGNVHLLKRDPISNPPIPERLEDWWLTRADGESDGV